MRSILHKPQLKDSLQKLINIPQDYQGHQREGEPENPKGA